ncbi:Sau3AI family type II restriction endonuclease [Staphylococcus kloosii]|jgi:DNA mismatch repair protein MutH|uniref:Sau3AI family type II restriction endonuclease n=1 Tax=Staphylococcus kloosii TaxID=29384 RepID=UPI00189CBE3B|nr:Sau3AI family type II restriction endonuclease [Staphylococcus kloosii]MBF7030180.1 DNA mismatch repair protein MutH [Staphylococcus kloosii]
MVSEYFTKEEVHNRAKDAVGITLKQMSKDGIVKSTKSSMGDAFENWFGKRPDIESKPDMEEAGVELKATPFKKIKNNMYSAKERLVLNMINYNNVINEDFETSHFLYKNNTIEIAFYEHNTDIDKSEWFIKEVVLYQMKKNPIDFEIIKQDWEKIYKFIEEGRAHELSEKHFQYLSPCTKGKNGESVTTQPNSNIKAKTRAYSLKSGYMTALLRNFVLGNKKNNSIIKDRIEVKEKSIEEIVLEKINQYIGWTVEELKNKFNIQAQPKNINKLIISAILDLNGKNTLTKNLDEIEEFEKASIEVKTIQVNKNNKNIESMSFPTFDFKELAEEEWEDEDGKPTAHWHNFLLETKFLFVVFKENGDDTIFRGAKFHSIPEEIINTTIKEVWIDTRNKLREGIKLKTNYQKNGKLKITNNFIGVKDQKICHVRPHANESDYSVNGKYARELPTPAIWIDKPEGNQYSNKWMTKSCFWINNSYIREQIKDLIE